MDNEIKQTATSTINLTIVFALVTMDVVARLLPHAPNFTPVAASALFAGAFLGSRLLALAVPLTAMGLSDWFIGPYEWHVMLSVYASLAVPAMLGRWVKSSSSRISAVLLAVGSSVIFFLVTNLAVWAYSGMYARDVTGLIKCYVAALPFFQNTLMGDAFWTIALFGGAWIWELACAPRKLLAGARQSSVHC